MGTTTTPFDTATTATDTMRLPDSLCTHTPKCPAADSTDREAARIVAGHPEQGWSLLCNGVLIFEDTGDLLPTAVSSPRTDLLRSRPDDCLICPHRPPPLRRAGSGGDGESGSSVSLPPGGSPGQFRAPLALPLSSPPAPRAAGLLPRAERVERAPVS